MKKSGAYFQRKTEENIAQLKKYFNSIPEFRLLPEFYKERIASFFIEERHYMVDPSDVKMFLHGGNQFNAFKEFDSLIKWSKENPIKRILGCKRHFFSISNLSDWIDRLHKLETDADMIIVLTHSLGFELDEPEEWYIANSI